jgi:hypothetical protein
MDEYRLEWRIFDCFFSVAGEWRKCNEELRKFCSSPNINREQFEDDVDGTCNMWERGEMRTKYYSGKRKRRGHENDLCISGRIILKWI